MSCVCKQALFLTQPRGSEGPSYVEMAKEAVTNALADAQVSFDAVEAAVRLYCNAVFRYDYLIIRMLVMCLVAQLEVRAQYMSLVCLVYQLLTVTTTALLVALLCGSLIT